MNKSNYYFLKFEIIILDKNCLVHKIHILERTDHNLPHLYTLQSKGLPDQCLCLVHHFCKSVPDLTPRSSMYCCRMAKGYDLFDFNKGQIVILRWLS